MSSEETSIRTALIVNQNMVGVLRVFREFERQKDRLAKVYPLEEGKQIVIPDSVDTIIFGAWDDQYGLESSVKMPDAWKTGTIIEGKNIVSKPFKAYTLWTSPIAQSEMEPFELEAIMELKSYVEKNVLDGIWFGDPSWKYFFPDDKKYWYSPYPISMKKPPLFTSHNKSVLDPKQVSIFGPLNMRKNFYSQMAAVKATGAIVHTNRMDELQKRFCDAVGVKYVNHPWMPEKEYYSTLQSMDLGMQVSFNGVESLSYVFIDNMQMNVPCLTSVEYAPSSLQVSPSDIHCMVQKIRKSDELGPPSGFPNWREWIKSYAETRNKQFNSIFQEKGL